MDRKKQLKMEYLTRKPPMGVFVYECLSAGHTYVGSSADVKSSINGTTFRLLSGRHMNQELLEDWKTFGEASFTIRVAELLEYKEDEEQTDYSQELLLLQEIWIEKLQKYGSLASADAGISQETNAPAAEKQNHHRQEIRTL